MAASNEDALARIFADAAEARIRRLPEATRRSRGVVHTPLPIARFMAQALDKALRDAGASLADDCVVIDPACGPGVFLAAALEAGAADVVGLDRDADAIADARRILGDSVGLIVHDTLTGPAPVPSERAGTRVILGNPPWASRSANREASYTEALMRDFRQEADGAPLRERKIGVLSDDYVRFWRWACEEARRAPQGAVALVTNASFLDGPVHRGMRARIAQWFDRVDVIDLGGSSLVAKAGRRDENLFDVRPGAAVVIAVRRGRRGVSLTTLRGAKSAKWAALRAPLASTRIELHPPLYAWVARNVDEDYRSWPSLPALMPFHREGVQTNRDAFCTDPDRERLLERLRAFADGASPQPGRAHLRSRHYDPARARAVVAALDLEARVQPMAYRPFETRWALLVNGVCHRPRPTLLEAFERSTFALLTVRKDRGERAWSHFGVARRPVDNCWLSSRSSCRTRAFPTHRPDGSPNVGDAAWGVTSGERLAAYALAFLAAPSYRARFDAALRADYPRIPPSDDFEAIADVGLILTAAFRAASTGPEVRVGHRRVASRALSEALEAADALIAPRMFVD